MKRKRKPAKITVKSLVTGEQILARKMPLSKATLRRVQAAIRKHEAGQP